MAIMCSYWKSPKRLVVLLDRLKEMASSLIMVHELSKTRASSCHVKQLGIDMEILSNPVTIGIGSEFVKISSQEGLHDYGNMLKRLFPQNAYDIERIMQEIDKTISYMNVMYGIDNPLFSDLSNDTQYLLHTLLPWFVNTKET